MFAQQKSKTHQPASVSKKETNDDNLNKKDSKGKKQGMWLNKQEAAMGEPAYMEFGSYQDDRKTGMWYKIDFMGRIQSLENYSKGVLNGQSQYYNKGQLVCIGHYRGLNPDNKFDTFYVTIPETHLDSLVILPSERGTLKHGLWRYYDPSSGQLTLEEEYQVDELIRSKKYYISETKDSVYINKRKADLPHNKTPKGLKPSHKPPKYTY